MTRARVFIEPTAGMRYTDGQISPPQWMEEIAKIPGRRRSFQWYKAEGQILERGSAPLLYASNYKNVVKIIDYMTENA